MCVYLSQCDEFFGLLADFTEELQLAVEKELAARAKTARDAGRAAGGKNQLYFKGRHKVRRDSPTLNCGVIRV